MTLAKEYYLMHKDIIVCFLMIDENGNISKIRKNDDAADHFPLGGRMNDMKFHEWWKDRAIPKTRHGAKNALEKLGYPNTQSALVNNLALSLTDCYWIKPRNENIKWSEINLFTNNFIDAFGEITINRDYALDIRNKTRFDCATSQGELQKKWCIDKEGNRYLIKGNYGNSYQQSINELFATELHKKQNFDNFTEYRSIYLKTESENDALGCYCYNYCNENVESISAWELLQTTKIKQNESFYYPFKEVCLSVGITEAAFNHFIDYQILTDFLLTNTDRHMNNIALLRDSNTLNFIGFAPIYDTGNSMFYNIETRNLCSINFREIKTHSFLEKEEKLLKYVSDRKALDLSKTDISFDLYKMDVEERHSRIPLLEKLYSQKRELIESFQNGKDIWKDVKR